jgi:hypothetical protein
LCRRFRQFDPFEDIERSCSTLYLSEVVWRFRQFDPFEDIERSHVHR